VNASACTRCTFSICKLVVEVILKSANKKQQQTRILLIASTSQTGTYKLIVAIQKGMFAVLKTTLELVYAIIKNGW